MRYKDESVVRDVGIMRFGDFVGQEKGRCVNASALGDLYSMIFLAMYPGKEGLLGPALRMFKAEVFPCDPPLGACLPQMYSSNSQSAPLYPSPQFPQSPSMSLNADMGMSTGMDMGIGVNMDMEMNMGMGMDMGMEFMPYDATECAHVHMSVMNEAVWACGPRAGGNTGFVGHVDKYQGLSRYVTLGAIVWCAGGVEELRFDEEHILSYFYKNPSEFDKEREELRGKARFFWAQVPGALQFPSLAFPAFFEWFSRTFLQGIEWSLLQSLFALLPRFLTRDGERVTLETWSKFFACFWRGDKQPFAVGEWLLLADEFGGFISASESEKAFSSGSERQCLVRYSESLGDYGCLVFSWSLQREKLLKFVNIVIVIAIIICFLTLDIFWLVSFDTLEKIPIRLFFEPIETHFDISKYLDQRINTQAFLSHA